MVIVKAVLRGIVWGGVVGVEWCGMDDKTTTILSPSLFLVMY